MSRARILTTRPSRTCAVKRQPASQLAQTTVFSTVGEAVLVMGSLLPVVEGFVAPLRPTSSFLENCMRWTRVVASKKERARRKVMAWSPEGHELAVTAGFFGTRGIGTSDAPCV